MNYLAHFHLAGSDPGMTVGALLGDFVKGPLRGQYPPAIEAGISLHRKIDAWVDQHPGCKTSSRLFNSPYRRYSGILLDLAGDHFLSLHWQRYHSTDLGDFAEQIYACLLQHHSLLPTNAQRFSQRLIEYRLLQRYHDWQTIDRSLINIASRLRRDNPLASASSELQRQLPPLARHFADYYPELMRYCALQRQLLLQEPL